MSNWIKNNLVFMLLAVGVTLVVAVLTDWGVRGIEKEEMRDEQSEKKIAGSLKEEGRLMSYGEVLEISGMRYKVFYGAGGVSWVINVTNDSLDKLIMEGELK